MFHTEIEDLIIEQTPFVLWSIKCFNLFLGHPVDAANVALPLPPYFTQDCKEFSNTYGITGACYCTTDTCRNCAECGKGLKFGTYCMKLLSCRLTWGAFRKSSPFACIATWLLQTQV